MTVHHSRWPVCASTKGGLELPITLAKAISIDSMPGAGVISPHV